MTPRRMNEEGSGVVEATVITLLLTVFVSLALSASYLVFAKYLIQYESEQTLYCLLQGDPPSSCEKGSKSRLQRFLPWGVTQVRASGLKRTWVVSIFFEWEQIKWISKKTINEKKFVARQALHW